MIHVRFKQDDSGLSACFSGHAGMGAVGKDIVCSAASILYYTAAKSLEDFAADGSLDAVTIDERNGFLSCRPKEGMEESVRMMFSTVGRGFELLSAFYPQAVEFETFGDPERD